LEAKPRVILRRARAACILQGFTGADRPLAVVPFEFRAKYSADWWRTVRRVGHTAVLQEGR
jgi:hypothetical protein